MNRTLILNLSSDTVYTKEIKVPTFKKSFRDSSDTINDIINTKYKCKITIENTGDEYKIVRILFIIDSKTSKIMLLHSKIKDKLIEISESNTKRCRLNLDSSLVERLYRSDNNIINYADQYTEYKFTI